MNRKLLIAALGVIALGIGAYFAFFGKSDLENQQAHARWISAHTSGTMSAYSPVKVYFTKNIIAEDQTGTVVPNGVLDISPSIDGQAIWVQPNVLEFTPAKPFENGESYSASVDLAKMIDSLKVDDYEFTFDIIPQDFTLDIDGIVPINMQKSMMFKVYGTLTLADKASQEAVDKMLDARIESENFSIKWEVDNTGRFYQFTVDSIARTDKSRNLKIVYTGDPIGVSKKGETSYKIPSKNDFMLTGHKVQQYPDQQVTLFFSDPVKRYQDLRGLFSFSSIKGYQVDVAGNRVIIQPDQRQKITDQLRISQSVVSTNNKKLGKDTTFTIVFEELKPAVRKLSEDVILPPGNQGALFAFEAVNLRAVDVRIYRVFENNIIQFLQVNSFTGDYQLNRVGKPVFEKTVVLNQYANTDLGQWNTFYIDLNNIVEQEPGALYHIQITYREENAITQCAESVGMTKAVVATSDFWKKFDNYYYSNNYSWREREDPCKSAYYGYRRAMKHNFMVSDIGLIAKVGQANDLTVFTTKLSTTSVLPEVNVEILDYQQQVLASEKTDVDGKVVFTGLEKPHFIRASDGNHTSYLRLTGSEALSYSHFPTDGVTVQDGIKGFIYNERGVYRPGDTIYTGFMLHDITGNLPENAPITIELYNARGQQAGKHVLQRNQSDHYLVHYATQTDDETGRWNIKAMIGNITFSHSISVETVKPNRLKIDIDIEKTIYAGENQTINMHSEWLHGAPVSNLKYTVEGAARKSYLKFEKYPGFEFNHKEQQLNTSAKQYHSGTLDASGDAKIPPYSPKGNALPSKINLSYFLKIFEPNGNFSISSARQAYLPYKSYVGLRLPEPNGRYNMFQTNKPINVEVVAATPKGEKYNNTVRTKIKIYKVSWSWWWESSESFGYHYNRYKKLKETKYVNIESGESTFELEMEKNEWGRYLIEVTNLQNNQTASSFIYFDWPSIAGRNNRPDGVSQNMLRFATDKEEYITGETVNMSFPTTQGGKALISIEDGVKVIETYWVDTQEKETSFSFKTTPAMSPNCYINIHYLQAYQNTINDLPLRLYGVAGINVSNPDTKLNPVIEMDETVETGKEFEITISEQEGKPMNYTIAIVDEGLLALTNFKTPNPHKTFFSHEALGVVTYDLFDWVIGAFNGSIERVIGIGGGADMDSDPEKNADQRFKPVVVVEGPFALKGGKSMTHKIKLPPYIGEVRTMVIARNDEAFGKAERHTKVKSPLMVMTTAPRKLVMNDKFMVPVNIFRDQSSSGSVSVELKYDNNIKVDNPKRKISFGSGQEEKMIFFECTAGKSPGHTNFSVHAMDGSYSANESLYIEIYNPTPTIYNVDFVQLKDNERRAISVDPIGAPGTNKLTAEIATMPPFNAHKHFSYLLNYPHGCIEQTVSGVFGLINAPKIMQISDEEQKRMTEKIDAALKKLKKFQYSSGGFGYWPGSSNVNEWGTNYGGHFMVVAEKAGYKINEAVYNKWLRYQKTMAKNWVDNGTTSRFNQAYRLYTLALAGKSQRGAMNRLRGLKDLHSVIKWRLAAAYAVDGRKNAAEKLISSLSAGKQTTTIRYTYGSYLRDQAMVLQTLDYLGKETEAFNLITEMSEKMIEDSWHSTQTRAWVLYAISDYYLKRDVAREINVSYSINNGKKNDVSTNKHMVQVDLPLKFSLTQNIDFTNKSGGETFLQLINQGKPFPKEINADASNLSINVSYMDFERNTIDISNLNQTTDFIAKISVKHPGIRSTYRDLALTFTVPGGWEIVNTRFTEFGGGINESSYTFRDFRDTQVLTYFDLGKEETKTFYIKLNATYPGTYYFSPVSVEAMYDHLINARTKSQFVDINKKE